MDLVQVLLQSCRCISVAALLGGCAVAGSHPVPQEGPTMKQIWDQQMKATSQNNIAIKRASVGAPLVVQAPSSEVAKIRGQFPKLPNPDIELFVKAHLLTGQGVPVGSYITVFRLYERDHYALPHEVIPKEFEE